MVCVMSSGAFPEGPDFDETWRTARVFLGEYAANDVMTPHKANTFGSALAEAAFLTGIERNSDVAAMTSYAPLFAMVDGAPLAAAVALTQKTEGAARHILLRCDDDHAANELGYTGPARYAVVPAEDAAAVRDGVLQAELPPRSVQAWVVPVQP